MADADVWASLAAELTSVPPLNQTVFTLPNLAFLAIFLVVLALIKSSYSLLLWVMHKFRGSGHQDTPFKALDTLLVEEDNKAVALSFGSFALSVCIMLSGAFDQLNLLPLVEALTSAVTFLCVGFTLVLASKFFNASTLSSSVRAQHDAMVYEGSLASGAIDASSFLGASIMARSVLLGPAVDSLAVGVGKTVVLWIVLRVVLAVLTLMRQASCNVVGRVLEARETAELRRSQAVLATAEVIEAGDAAVEQAIESGDAAGEQAQEQLIVAANPASAPVAIGRQIAPTTTYKFANVRRQMNTATAIASNDMHAGFVLSADIISSALILSAPVPFTASLTAIVTWAIYATLVHGAVVVVLDLAIYRSARLHFAKTNVLGAAVLEVACVLASSQFVSSQFRDAFSPLADAQPSPAFGELADVVFSVSLSGAGVLQLLLFIAFLIGFISLASVLFSLEYIVSDLRAGNTPKLEPVVTPALAVSYAGYCFAHSLIFAGVLDCVAFFVVDQILSILLWAALGLSALAFSQFTANKLLLRSLENGALLREDNMAVAIVDLGHSVSAGLIIQAAISGDADSIAGGVVTFLIFFLMTQVLFLVFSALYQLVTTFNDADLFRENNVAAAVGHSMSQIALGYMLSSPIRNTSSLASFCIQAALSILLLLLARLFVDRFMLPLQKLDLEISKDKNWGAALIEGCFAIGVAVFIEALLPVLSEATCNQLLFFSPNF